MNGGGSSDPTSALGVPDGEELSEKPCVVEENNHPSIDSKRVSTSSVWTVYLTVAVDMLGFGLLIPYLPFLAMKFIGDDNPRGLGMGFMTAAFSICQVVGAFILGRFSDVVGRKPVLLLSLVGSVVSLVLTGFVTNYAWLVAVRGFTGLSAGNVAVAQAYIADITTLKERPKYMGLIGASLGFGLVLGPALGGGLSKLGDFRLACHIAAGICGVNLLMAIFLVRESNTHRWCCGRSPVETHDYGDGSEAEARNGDSKVHRSMVGALIHLLITKPSVVLLFGANFFFNAAFTYFEAIASLYGADRFNISEFFIGVLLFMFGMVMVFNQAVTMRFMLKYLSPRYAAVIGSIIYAVFIASIPWANNLYLMSSLFILAACGVSYPNTCISSLVSNYSDETTHGMVLGLGQGAGALARAIAPILSGWTYDKNRNLPFYISGGLGIVTTICMLAVCVPREGNDADRADDDLKDPLLDKESC